MLKELHIENLAIIEKVDIELSSGMVVLTGETGAGKSIILNGINMLIGEKLKKDMIRFGAEKVVAEGVFEISEKKLLELNDVGIELEDREIIVRREMGRDGKTKAWLNGRRTPVTQLKAVMESIVDIVGQYSHQMLLNSKGHIKLIDKFLKDEDKRLKIEIANVYDEYREVEKSLKEINRKKEETKEKKALYEFQIKEIDLAELEAGEDDELEEEYKRLFNSGKIKDKLKSSLSFLRVGELNVLSMIGKSIAEIESIKKYSENFETIVEKMESAKYELEDIVYSIEGNLDDLNCDDFRLVKIVARLDKINELKKKYGISAKNILEYREEINEFLESLESGSSSEKALVAKKEEILLKYSDFSKKLSEKRKEISKNIEYKLVEILKSLSMGGVQFKVGFEKRGEITKNGMDRVEFMISTNVGEELKPLSKIVSGGEVSRIMLALKTIFSEVDNIPLLIFDEIDTGIGGETVKQVGEKLKEISFNAQVITISHTAVIASKADEHFYINKNVESGKTVTNVFKLSKEERVNEISRMIAGENISENVREHAKELLKEG